MPIGPPLKTDIPLHELTAIKEELERLRTELAELKAERDLLKDEVSVLERKIQHVELKAFVDGRYLGEKDTKRHLSRIAELNQAVLALSRYSDWPLTVSEEEQDLIDKCIRMAEEA